MKAGIARFRAEDYRTLAANYLGDITQFLSFEKVFRFAPKLNAYQLRAACEWLLRYEPEIDTEKLIDYLRSQRLTSNVDLGEVQEVTLSDLIGVDDVIRNLEIHIANRFRAVRFCADERMDALSLDLYDEDRRAKITLPVKLIDAITSETMFWSPRAAARRPLFCPCRAPAARYAILSHP